MDLEGCGHVERFLLEGVSLRRLARGAQQVGLRVEVLEPLLVLDRAVGPLQSLLVVRLVLDAVGRGVVPADPVESLETAELLAKARQGDLGNVHGDFEGHGELLPPERRDRRVGLKVLEVVDQ